MSKRPGTVPRSIKRGLSPKDRRRIAVLISGSGSNLQALIDSVNNGSIAGEIVIVLSNNKDAFGLQRAQKAGIDTKVINPNDFGDRQSYDQELIKIIDGCDVDLVVLAGYMLICSKQFVEYYYGRLINLHPSLLPAFAGADAIGDALKAGVKETGVTVHFVDEGCDTGPIIFQEPVAIEEGDTKESLASKIHEVEHRLLPKAIKYFAEGRIKLEGRQVVIK